MYVGSDGSGEALLRDEKLLVRARTFHLLVAGGYEFGWGGGAR